MKAMVLLSGGVDSATCLALAAERYGRENVRTLSVYYGQRHERELKAARAVARHYRVECRELDLSEIFAYSSSSLLSDSDEEIPMESYEEQLKKTDGTPVATYVPFRNGLFLSCAASVASSEGCGVVFYGAHRDDAAGDAYPDCSGAFKQAMGEAIFLGSGGQVRLEAPFVDRTKAEVIKRGLELGVPYELTWSCYVGGKKPCGKCGTCIDRARAFAANGVEDPARREEAGKTQVD